MHHILQVHRTFPYEPLHPSDRWGISFVVKVPTNPEVTVFLFQRVRSSCTDLISPNIILAFFAVFFLPQFYGVKLVRNAATEL